MLKPAQLYKEQLEREQIKSWYDPRNIYWNGGAGDYMVGLPDNNAERHCFVSVDKDDNVIGYIEYQVDWVTLSADRFGMISFRKGSLEFARDIYRAVCDIFEKYGLRRIQWCCYADNPAVRGYHNFIKKHGGVVCGYFRQNAMLQDGKLHDTVDFEILKSEFRP